MNATFPDILRARAHAQPDQLALRFLADGTVDSARDWTYADLARHASVIAADLRASHPDGGRVVLALEPGITVVVLR